MPNLIVSKNRLPLFISMDPLSWYDNSRGLNYLLCRYTGIHCLLESLNTCIICTLVSYDL